MESKGMATHSISSFNESKAVEILKQFLECKNTIKTFFGENDRTPNHDGFFELIDTSNKTFGTPKKQFIVQIKKADSSTTSLELQDDGKYRYNLDTKFLYYIKEKVAESPAIYFVVDINTKKIFYIYLSDEKLMELDFEEKGSVVYYFDETERVTDIDSFTKKLTQIANYRNRVFVNKTEEQIIELQEAIEYINNLFNNDLLFIKEQLFPNLWRFGIGNSTDEISIKVGGTNNTFSNANLFGLYPQIKGKKDFGYSEYDINSMFRHLDMTGKMTPLEYVNDVITKILETYFNSSCIIKYVGEQIIKEILGEAINKLEIRLGIRFERNEENKVAVESIYKTLYAVTLYINNVMNKENLTEQEKGVKQNILQRLKFFNLDRNIDSVTLISMLTRKEFLDFYSKEYNKISNEALLNTSLLSRECVEYVSAIERAKELNITEIEPNESISIKSICEFSEEELYNFFYNWFEDLKVVYEETFNKVIKNIDYKKKGRFQYMIKINNEEKIGIFKVNWNVLKYDSNILEIEADKSIDNFSTNVLKERKAKAFSSGFSISAFLNDKYLYNSLRCIMYEGICDKLGIKCKGMNMAGMQETLFE